MRGARAVAASRQSSFSTAHILVRVLQGIRTSRTIIHRVRALLVHRWSTRTIVMSPGYHCSYSKSTWQSKCRVRQNITSGWIRKDRAAPGSFFSPFSIYQVQASSLRVSSSFLFFSETNSFRSSSTVFVTRYVFSEVSFLPERCVQTAGLHESLNVRKIQLSPWSLLRMFCM